jgi:hypothetical protein
VTVGISVGVLVGEAVGVAVAFGSGVFVCVAVGVSVGVEVCVGVLVGVNVGNFGSLVGVLVGVDVAVGVFVGVLVGGMIGPAPTGIEPTPVSKFIIPTIVRALDDLTSRGLMGINFTSGLYIVETVTFTRSLGATGTLSTGKILQTSYGLVLAGPWSYSIVTVNGTK